MAKISYRIWRKRNEDQLFHQDTDKLESGRLYPTGHNDPDAIYLTQTEHSPIETIHHCNGCIDAA